MFSGRGVRACRLGPQHHAEQIARIVRVGEQVELFEMAGLRQQVVDVAQGRQPPSAPAMSLPHGGTAESQGQEPVNAGGASACERAKAAAQAEAEQETVNWNSAVEAARAALRAISLSPALERKIVAFFQNMA